MAIRVGIGTFQSGNLEMFENISVDYHYDGRHRPYSPRRWLAPVSMCESCTGMGGLYINALWLSAPVPGAGRDFL